MDLTLLYSAGCPNWQEADRRLREALAVVGRAGTPVTRRAVETPADAERLGFRGSPTLLVDGRDPFAEASSPGGLTCRVYRTPEGLAGAPTVAQLVAVLGADAS